MNEQNVKFLRDRNIQEYVIETFLDTVILEDEKFLAINCITKNLQKDFYDSVLLLTDRRIIKVNINAEKMSCESYSLKLINGFNLVKTYMPHKDSIRSVNFIEKIVILLRNKINNNDYLEIEFDENSKKLGLEIQKKHASEFIKELAKLL